MTFLRAANKLDYIYIHIYRFIFPPLFWHWTNSCPMLPFFRVPGRPGYSHDMQVFQL